MKGLVWFREDLRIIDNPALYHAAQSCKAGIIALYLIDISMWKQHHMAACRVEFILEGLTQLRQDLEKLNIPLQVIDVNSHSIPEILLKFIKTHDVQALFFNKQFELNEQKRDQNVVDVLTKQGIKCEIFQESCILPPGTILNKQGQFFQIFTAYKRAWQTSFLEKNLVCYPAPKKQKPIHLSLNLIPNKLAGVSSPVPHKLWPAGEKAANNHLNHFIENSIQDYHRTRDYPAIAGTSQLSPYLSAGMISARQCFLTAAKKNDYRINSGQTGIVTWLSELIWRDFYKHLLVANPRVCMYQPYKLETQKLLWNENPDFLEAWQQGRTGFPFVDAGMRQLNQTGWMHNRLRMVTAMFFTKNCFLDWRKGEKYFINHLIDGDLAANNGGWQWCASTGTDAAPYFRIFNPVLQGKRFDPQGEFIKKYCPELRDFNEKEIHEPFKFNPDLAKKNNYPTPILDLKKTAQATVAAFKKISRH